MALNLASLSDIKKGTESSCSRLFHQNCLTHSNQSCSYHFSLFLNLLLHSLNLVNELIFEHIVYYFIPFQTLLLIILTI